VIDEGFHKKRTDRQATPSIVFVTWKNPLVPGGGYERMKNATTLLRIALVVLWFAGKTRDSASGKNGNAGDCPLCTPALCGP